jgi:hemerythrin-like metal-binding protein
MSTTKTTAEPLGAVMAACRQVDAADSQDVFVEQLIPLASTAVGGHEAALTALVEQGSANPRILHGDGRFAPAIEQLIPEEEILERLRGALAAGNSVMAPGFVVFLVQHPAQFSLLVYLELTQPLDAERERLLPFFIDRVGSALAALYYAKLSERTTRATVAALASLAEHKDHNTGEHILRVARMADEMVHVLEEMGAYPDQITPEFKRFVGTASILHDVGKVAIPDSILQKPAALDPEEWEIVRGHTFHGKRVLDKVNLILESGNYLIDLAGEVALTHHEHFSGQGYPMGLVGQHIPLASRIVALVDVFDALTSRRPYKPAWPEEEAVDYIRQRAGEQFDPILVEAFLKVMAYRRETLVADWTSRLSVNVELLDEDHQRLIGLINQLAMSERIGNRRIVESVLDELMNYTIEHFQREEAMMAERGYAKLESHMRQHAVFAETVNDIRWQYLHGLRSNINQKVLRFLMNWLQTHIYREDRGVFAAAVAAA